jgi:hypothetical protein
MILCLCITEVEKRELDIIGGHNYGSMFPLSSFSASLRWRKRGLDNIGEHKIRIQKKNLLESGFSMSCMILLIL